MVFEICAVIATIVFIALAAYLIQTLISVQSTLKQLNALINNVDTKINPLSLETRQILQNSQDLTKTLQGHLEAFSPLLQSIRDIGTIIQRTTGSLNKGNPIKEELNLIRPRFEEKKESRREKLEEIIELVALGILFWKQINKRR